jgi:hypothetical protein
MCLSFEPRIGGNRHEFKTPLFAFLRVQCVNIDPRMFHPFRHREWMRLADWDLSLSEFTSKITQPGVHYSLAKNALAEPNVFCGLVANNRSRERNPQFRRVAIDSGKFAFSLRFQVRIVNLGFSIPAPGLLLSQEILR